MMNKSLLSVAIAMTIAAMTYFGFVADVQGAQNIMKFYVWVVCLPLGLLALMDAFQREMAKTPPPSLFRRILSRCVSTGVLVVIVWQGHIVTGIAFGFFLLCGAISTSATKKLRDQNVERELSSDDA